MARLSRLVAPGRPPHIVQSGHNRHSVSLDAADRSAWRDALREAAGPCRVAVHAYAIGARRALLLATPATTGGLSLLMQRVGRRYTRAFNARHGRSGTLWNGRFGAAVLEPRDWLLAAMRLVDADAAAVDALGSAAHHRGLGADPLVTDHPAFWALGNTPFERNAAYALLADSALPPDQIARLEHAMAHGWAVGSAGFLAGLSAELGRPVTPRAPGRPRHPPVVNHDGARAFVSPNID